MLKTVLNLQSLDLAGLMIQVFMGSSQHQLDPVQLVYLAGSGIIVHGNDVGLWMLAAQLLDDALSNDMVGQAAKGLDADDVPGAALGFPGRRSRWPWTPGI